MYMKTSSWRRQRDQTTKPNAPVLVKFSSRLFQARKIRYFAYASDLALSSDRNFYHECDFHGYHLISIIVLKICKWDKVTNL